jgi:hypothetical protein
MQKSNQKKSRLYSNPTILLPSLAVKHGCSQPPPMAQNRDLNKAGRNLNEKSQKRQKSSRILVFIKIRVDSIFLTYRSASALS